MPDGTSARVVLATRNPHKVVEVQRILAAAAVDVAVVSLDDLEAEGSVTAAPEVAETGDTFAANALLKARAIAAHTGLVAVADDSGLCVDALNGMPGIFSARWSGRHGDDAANLRLVLADRRRARGPTWRVLRLRGSTRHSERRGARRGGSPGRRRVSGAARTERVRVRPGARAHR